MPYSFINFCKYNHLKNYYIWGIIYTHASKITLLLEVAILTINRPESSQHHNLHFVQAINCIFNYYYYGQITEPDIRKVTVTHGRKPWRPNKENQNKSNGNRHSINKAKCTPLSVRPPYTQQCSTKDHKWQPSMNPSYYSSIVHLPPENMSSIRFKKAIASHPNIPSTGTCWGVKLAL